MLPSPPFPYVNSCIDTSQMNFCRKKKLYLVIVLFLREQHFIYQNHYTPWSSLQVNIFFVKCKSNFRNVNPRERRYDLSPTVPGSHRNDPPHLRGCPVGNGNHGPVSGHPFQSLQDCFFRLCIEVCRDFVEQ